MMRLIPDLAQALSPQALFAQAVVPEWIQDRDTALLVIALLLALWLWLLVRRREDEQRRPTRSTPLSHEELALVCFRCGTGQDLETYRGLFLNGSEAFDMLGDDAETYLEARTFSVLRDSLALLGERIPHGAVFHGVALREGDRLEMEVKLQDGRMVMGSLGTVVRVGVAWRLFGPAS